jgi:hypothetical protein
MDDEKKSTSGYHAGVQLELRNPHLPAAMQPASSPANDRERR